MRRKCPRDHALAPDLSTCRADSERVPAKDRLILQHRTSFQTIEGDPLTALVAMPAIPEQTLANDGRRFRRAPRRRAVARMAGGGNEVRASEGSLR